MSEAFVTAESRQAYLQPLHVALALSFVGEFGIWILWAFVLAPEGDPMAKLAWLLVCGLAMGSAIGCLTDLLVVGRLAGRAAWLASASIALAVFVGCDLLCFELDHHYGFWATREHPVRFLASGIALGVMASALYATLLFTSFGRACLERLGL
jgi:hypothetical protein